jgi:peptide/nickel transport system substrate-binding protein
LNRIAATTGVREGENAVRHPVKVAAVGVLAVGLFASGCSQVSNTPGGNSSSGQAQAAFIVDYAGEIKGPAPDVPGAVQGGTLTIVSESDFDHLDPQQIYVSNALSHGGSLFHRSLTYYIEDPNGGPLKLVGDLATSAGETADNGKTWKYTLRDGIKFDDGTAITSADVAYAIARSFSTYGEQGPQYIQSILDASRAYKGPYSGQLLPPGVTTPDAKTIIFTLPEAHPEFPFLLSFPISTPVPQAKDSKAKYDDEWVSSGPYKRKEYQPDVKLVLEKNTNWDPNSDPIRKQYVDEIVFEFGVDANAQTNRLQAAAGADAAALMDANVSPELIASVKSDTAVMPRVHAGPTPFVTYLYINTQRVTDLTVRQALNYAHNRDAYIKAVGGYDVAQPATTILAPIVPGYKQFDIYKPTNGGNEGDVEKAKQLLAGKTPRLKLCFANTPVNQTVYATIAANLKRAGFDFVNNPIDPASYYTTVGDKTIDCDLMGGGWGQDFADGESTLGVLMDGSKIVDKGNNNLAYFNDPGVVSTLKTLREATDRASVASQYGDLDEKIMKDFAPVVPLRYLRNFTIAGPRVGNTYMSPLFAHFNLTRVYIKAA